MGECPSSIGWALRSSAAADKGSRGWAHTLVPSTPGSGRGEFSESEGTKSDLDPGPGAAVETPCGSTSWEAQETGRGSAGASPTPCPGTAESASGCVPGPSAPVASGSRGLQQPALRLGRLQRDAGVSGKGRAGETRRARARKELPLSGKDFDAKSHPRHPSPAPCTPASGSPA